MSDEREPDRQLLIRRWSKKENDSRIVSAGELTNAEVAGHQLGSQFSHGFVLIAVF
jgi:hypothetical protein